MMANTKADDNLDCYKKLLPGRWTLPMVFLSKDYMSRPTGASFESSDKIQFGHVKFIVGVQIELNKQIDTEWYCWWLKSCISW